MKHSATNKVLSALLVLVMAVCLMSTSVLTAFAVTEYSLWVGGVRVTSANRDDIFGDGTACYYPANNVLELHDFVYTGSGYANSGIYYNSTGENLAIHVYGNCEITAENSKSTDLSGITVENTGLEIYGETITFATADEMLCFGIWVSQDLLISGAEVYAVGGNATNNTYGVYVSNGDITVDGGGILDASTGHAVRNSESIGDSYAIFTDSGDMTVADGEVYAVSGLAEHSGGILTNGDITISDGIIDAVGKTAYTASYGIYCAGIFTAEGGEVYAQGGTATNASYGLLVGDQLFSYAGRVEAYAGVSEITYGIYVYNGMTIDGENAYVEGNAKDAAHVDVSDDAVYESYGIYCYDNAYIYDGTLYATGGSVSEGFTVGMYVYYDFVAYGGYVVIDAGNAYSSATGMYVERDFVANDKAYVNICSGSADEISTGLYVDGDVTVNSGEVHVTSGNADLTYGVYCTSEGTVTVTGGALYVEAVDGWENARGVYAEGDINVSGGLLYTEATYGTNGSYGMDCYGKLTVSGGKVYAQGGKSEDGESVGIWLETLDVSGGVLYTLAGEGYSCSIGVVVETAMTVSGGEVYAEGGTSNNVSYGVYLYEGTPCTLTGGDIVAYSDYWAFTYTPTITPSDKWSPMVLQGEDIDSCGDAVSVDKLDITNHCVCIYNDSADEGMLGDVDGNGAIDQFDYLLVKRAYFNTYALTADEENRADVDQSGEVDQMDYLYIKRHYFNTYVIG